MRISHSGGVGETVQCRLEYGQSQKEQRETGQRLPHGLAAVPAAGQPQTDTRGQQGQGESLDVDAETHQADQPAGHGGAHVGPDDYRESLGQGHQPRIHKTDGSDGYRPGMLDNAGDQHARRGTPRRRTGPVGQNVPELGAGGLFETVGHHLHGEQEQGKPAGNLEQHVKCHCLSSSLDSRLNSQAGKKVLMLLR